ncbi:MFS transporter [Peredibacter starrii]|uniref:MFS transporter n=1 Tax=Peredibacter starrii TaxID=28202 RepID=A0AAX4HK36_9BACT|nr:MFS transporter [Peredibacter starrii]WPU63555.1 MFS transporter [Peredibacter starrii]
MISDKTRSRWAISCMFFLHGLCFSSWGSRIPAIQEMHSLSEAQLGTLLLTLPVGSILSMALAAAFVSKFGSKKVLFSAILIYPTLLVTLGLAQTVWQLSILLVLFGLASNLVNISLNTQAVEIETIYGRSIMASMHGLWSLAGFVAAFIGAFMIEGQYVPYQHFLFIFAAIFIMAFMASSNLLPDRSNKSGTSTSLFKLPEKSLLILGVICFLSMICEGAMFDWSGIYFKKVVNAEGGWVGAGYVAFMSTMAGTRFIADGFREKFGMKKTLLVSGFLIATGLMISVIFPYLVPSLIGFLLVGSGVSAVVPMVLSEAGKTSPLSPSSAIASVSTIGFFGFLLGPPLIGWIAGASSLRISFTVIAIMGLSIAVLSGKRN